MDTCDMTPHKVKLILYSFLTCSIQSDNGLKLDFPNFSLSTFEVQTSFHCCFHVLISSGLPNDAASISSAEATSGWPKIQHW